MIKPLIFGAEVARKTVSAAGKVPGVDVALARAIIASSSVVPEAAQVHLSGESSGLRSLQEKAATVLFSANPQGAEKLLAQLEIDTITNPAHLERLAARYLKIGHFEAALAMRERAVELEPESAQRWLALAESLETAGPGGIVHDPVAGLTSGTVARVEESREALTRAAELEPDNAYVQYQLGRLEFEHGEPAKGLELMETSCAVVPTVDKWLTLGASYRKPHVADYDRSLHAYEQALRLKPSSPTAMRGVIIMGCRADQNWSRMWSNVRRFETARKKHQLQQRLELADALSPMFTKNPSDEQLEACIAQLDSAQEAGLRLSWIATSLVVYRLHFARKFSEGFTLRRGLAQRTLDWLGTRSAGHTGHRQKVLAALAYLDRQDELVSRIDPMPWKPQDELDRHRLEKLRVDAHLLGGDIRPYLNYATEQEQNLPLPGDEKMRALLEGKRVAVVGPADTGDRLGELIDSHDVVIRPRYMPQLLAADTELLGSRTDIAYFSGRDISEFFDEAERGVASGDLQLAIGRGLSIGVYAGDAPDWLRFYRHDFGLCFHGAPLGIARILYDVLQFNPAQVSVFNADFYTGTNVFSSGYRTGKDAALGPYSIVNEVLLAHDLLFDFRLMNALVDTGRVKPEGVTAKVLGLNEDQYIQRLETSAALT